MILAKGPRSPNNLGQLWTLVAVPWKWNGWETHSWTTCTWSANQPECKKCSNCLKLNSKTAVASTSTLVKPHCGMLVALNQQTQQTHVAKRPKIATTRQKFKKWDTLTTFQKNLRHDRLLKMIPSNQKTGSLRPSRSCRSLFRFFPTLLLLSLYLSSSAHHARDLNRVSVNDSETPLWVPLQHSAKHLHTSSLFSICFVTSLILSSRDKFSGNIHLDEDLNRPSFLLLVSHHHCPNHHDFINLLSSLSRNILRFTFSQLVAVPVLLAAAQLLYALWLVPCTTCRVPFVVSDFSACRTSTLPSNTWIASTSFLNVAMGNWALREKQRPV